MSLIADHKWRPPLKSSTKVRSYGPLAERPCEYAGCDRPREEHEKSVRVREVQR